VGSVMSDAFGLDFESP